MFFLNLFTFYWFLWGFLYAFLYAYLPYLSPSSPLSCLSFFETRFLCKVLSWNLLCRPWLRTRDPPTFAPPVLGLNTRTTTLSTVLLLVMCVFVCVWHRSWLVLESCKCMSLWSWCRKSFLITSHIVYWEKSSHWTSNKTIQACLDSQITPRILSLSPQCWAYRQLSHL